MEWAVSQGISVYSSYEEMLADKSVDAILIATPNHLHKSMAIGRPAGGEACALRKARHAEQRRPSGGNGGGRKGKSGLLPQAEPGMG